MSKILAYSLAFITGIIITLMVVANTELGRITSIEVSTIINQFIAIIVLSSFIAVARNNKIIVPEQKKSRWYWFFGGSFGIVIVLINYYTLINIGATFAMAGAVFGQSLMGLIIDVTGLLNLEKRKTTREKKISITISYLGILVMSVFSKTDVKIGYLALSILAGMITMFQMGYNSNFAKKKGTFISTLVNVTSGFITIAIISLLFFLDNTISSFSNLSNAPFYLIVGGSILGIFVVVITNIVIPQIPAVYSALLLSSGQIMTSLIFDYLLYERFSLSLLVGTLIMISGLAYGAIKAD